MRVDETVGEQEAASWEEEPAEVATALAAAATEAEREREVEVASTATSPNLLQPLSKRIRGHQRYGQAPLSTER